MQKLKKSRMYGGNNMEEKLLNEARNGDVLAQVSLAKLLLKEGKVEEAYQWIKEMLITKTMKLNLCLVIFIITGLKLQKT